MQEVCCCKLSSGISTRLPPGTAEKPDKGRDVDACSTHAAHSSNHAFAVPILPSFGNMSKLFHWPIACHGHHVPILFSYLVWQSKANSAIACHGHLHDPARRTHSKWTAELTSS